MPQGYGIMCKDASSHYIQALIFDNCMVTQTYVCVCVLMPTISPLRGLRPLAPLSIITGILPTSN